MIVFNDIKNLGNGRRSAITQDGSIWISTDGGTTWNQKVFGGLMSLWSHAYNGNYGIAVGDNIYFESFDQGETWSTMKSFPLFNDNGVDRATRFKGVCFSGSNVIAVGTMMRILVGPIAGGTWQQVSSISMSQLVTPYFNEVEANGAGVVLAVGSGGIVLQSTDNGWSWSVVRPYSTASPDGFELFDVRFVFANLAYAGGKQGTCIKSLDSGTTWSQQGLGLSNIQWDRSFRQLLPLDEHNLIGVGDYGAIMKSTDDGHTWVSKSDQYAGIFYAICKGDAASEIDVAGDYSAMLDSHDNGETWSLVFGAPPLRPLDTSGLVNTSTAIVTRKKK